MRYSSTLMGMGMRYSLISMLAVVRGWGWKRSAGSGANPPGRPLVRVHQREEAELISQTWAENTQTDKSELKIIYRCPEESSRDQASQRRPSQGSIRRIKKERKKYCVSKMKISKHKHKPHTFKRNLIQDICSC